MLRIEMMPPLLQPAMLALRVAEVPMRMEQLGVRRRARVLVVPGLRVLDCAVRLPQVLVRGRRGFVRGFASVAERCGRECENGRWQRREREGSDVQSLDS